MTEEGRNKLTKLIILIMLTSMLMFFLGVIFGAFVYVKVNDKSLITPENKDQIHIYIINDTKIEEKTIEDVKKTLKTNIKQSSRGIFDEFIVTAYDNSKESQGKWIDQTASGYILKNKSLTEAKCIAVDPTIIPLGSKVEMIFDKPYTHLSDTYIARDTGGAIRGRRIDLFMGDGVSREELMRFGRRRARVRVLE